MLVDYSMKSCIWSNTKALTDLVKSEGLFLILYNKLKSADILIQNAGKLFTSVKNWVERGLKETRVDNRVYYYYSDLIKYIENESEETKV